MQCDTSSETTGIPVVEDGVKKMVAAAELPVVITVEEAVYRGILVRVPSDSESESSLDEPAEGQPEDVPEEDISSFLKGVREPVIPEEPRLRREAKVFIPPYDPTLPKAMIRDIVSQAHPADLVAKGYPLWAAEAALRNDRFKPAEAYDVVKGQKVSRDRAVREETAARGPTGAYHNSYEKGAYAQHWVIPHYANPVAACGKPVRFTRAAFMNWVHFSEQTLTKTITSPRQYVTGNAACQFLYYYRGTATRRVEQEALASAAIYVADHKHSTTGFVERTPTVSAWLPDSLKSRDLLIGGKLISTQAELDQLQPEFKKKEIKHLYKLATRFLAGDEQVNGQVLQAALDGHFSHAHEQCWGRRPTFTHEHKVTVDIPFVDELLANVSADSQERIRRWVNVGSFVTAILTSGSWQNTAAIVVQFFSSNPSLWTAVSSFVSPWVAQVKTHFQGESFLASLCQPLTEFWDMIVSGSVLYLLQESATQVKDSMVLLVRDMVSGMRRETLRESAAAIARQIVLWIKDAFARITLAVNTRSLAPLTAKYLPGVWVAQADVLIYYSSTLTGQPLPAIINQIKELVEARLLSSDWTGPRSMEEYIAALERHAAEAKTLRAFFGGSPQLLKSITDAQESLATAIARYKNKSAATRGRPVPFGLYYYGTPGVGKTMLSTLLFQAIGNKYGYATDASGVYNWLIGANFQEMGSNHWGVFWDDVDINPRPAPGYNYVEDIVKIMNSKVCPIERAAIAEKDTTFAAPYLGQFCSNFKDANIGDKTNEPQAFFRRFHYWMEVRAKPEFCATGTTTLDPERMGITYDVLDIDVYRTVVKPGREWGKEFVKKMEVTEFIRFMTGAFDNHMTRERVRLSKQTVRDFCGNCYLSTAQICGCGSDPHPPERAEEEKSDDIHVSPQGGATSRPQEASDEQDDATSVEEDDCPEVEAADLADLFYLVDTSPRVPLDATSRLSKALTVAGSSEALDRFFRPWRWMARQASMEVWEYPQTFGWLEERFLATTKLPRELSRGMFTLRSWREGDMKMRAKLLNLFIKDDSEITLGVLIQAETYLTTPPLDNEVLGILCGHTPISLNGAWHQASEARKIALLVYAANSLRRPAPRPQVGWYEWVMDFDIKKWWAYDTQAEMFLDMLRRAVVRGALITLGLKVLQAFLDYKFPPKAEPQMRALAEGNVPQNWQRADQQFQPGFNVPFGTATFTLEDVEKRARACMVFIENGEMCCNGALVQPGIIMSTTHCFKLGDTIRIIQKDGGYVRTLTLNPMNFATCRFEKELCFIRHSNAAPTASLFAHMWVGVDPMVQTFDEVRIVRAKDICEAGQGKVERYQGHQIITTSFQTVDGDCGSVYIGKYGNTWKVVGMHYALLNYTFSSSRSAALVVTQSQVKAELVAFGERPLELNLGGLTITKDPTIPQSLQVGHYNPKSEYWTAVSQQMVYSAPIGEMVCPPPSTTMKTKIIPSLFHGELEREQWELKLLGIKKWTLPNFRGSMVDGKWTSPWQNMFKTNHATVMDFDLVALAVYDYCNGMDLLYREGYHVLSEEQVLTGVPGTYTNAVNMKTSVGPPFNVNKHRHIALDREQGSSMSSELCAQIDELESFLKVGPVAVMSMCTLKDEPVKLTNGVPKYPRVFCCMPFAFNFVAKKNGDWKNFMRNNVEFFESLVGVNMTSLDGVKEMQKLVLPHLFDGDVEAMDKSYCADMVDAISRVVYLMSHAIGIEAVTAYHIVQSTKFVVYNVKGDLFYIVQNPSGWDGTVEMNGMAISIGERMVWYKRNPYAGDMGVVREWYKSLLSSSQPFAPVDPLLTFRANVQLRTYGDDNVKACSRLLPETYECDWRELTGFRMKDAAKTDRMTPKEFGEISFLKRTFHFDPDVGDLVPRLDKASLVRMLLFKRDSTLGLRDHMAVVLTEFFREAVYWGREFYDEQRAYLLEKAERHQLTTNPYLRIPTFDDLVAQVRQGNYQTWGTRPAVEHPETDALSLSYQMKSMLSSEAVGFDGADQSSSAVAHETGEIHLSTAFSVSTTEAPLYYQTMPKTDLGAFLERAVMVADHTISNVDTPLQVVYSFAPRTLFLQNPAVADKIANFSFLRSTLQVIAVPSVPGGAYGSYVLAAIPSSETASIARPLQVENCMQVDHFGLIDISSSEAVVLQLPYVADEDFQDMSADPHWQVTLFCLSPVKTAVADGVTLGRIKFYVSMLDVEMAVPHYQGKHKMVANDAMKTYAPKVHSLIGEGKGSKMAGQIADVAGQLSKVPVIGQFASGVEWASRGAEAVLDFFGFTRDTREVPPTAMVIRSVANVARLNGQDSTVECAALDGENLVTIDPHARGFRSEDDSAFASLFPRWTLVKTASWATTDATGAILFSIPVTPFYGIHKVPSYVDGTAVQLPVAGYVGLPFAYWRGTMVYKFVIPVSSLHRGCIQILWGTQRDNPIGEVTNVALNHVRDVTAGMEFTVRVGFAIKDPVCVSRIITDAMPIIPTGASNGWLYVKVVNPLVSPNPTAGTSIHVFAAADPDMQFFAPRDHVRYMDSIAAPREYDMVRSLRLQGTLGNGKEDEAVIDLVPVPTVYPVKELLAGEAFGSVRALVQKPCRVANLDETNAGTLTLPKYGHIPGADYSGFIPAVWTWFGHYRAMFLGISGSEVYKVLTRDEAWVGMHTVNRDSPTAAVLPTSAMSPMTCTGLGKGAEFRLPYYYPRKYFPAGNIRNASAQTYVNTTYLQGAWNTTQAVVYHSAGPDVALMQFRQIPLVVFADTEYSLPQWFS